MDKRELILSRLSTVLGSLVDTGSFKRNSLDIAESRLPGIVMLDGDEAPDNDSGFAKGRGPKGPIVMLMMPEVFFINADSPDRVGTELNSFRGKIIDAVANDAQLAALAHNGDIRYGGMQTALANGRSLSGEAGMLFIIAYAMYPGTLTPESSSEGTAT